jgi:hypothetical protein
MTHFLRRQILLVQGFAAATVLFLAPFAHAQTVDSVPRAHSQVTVRLYDTAQLSPRIMNAALTAAARALSGAVDASWRYPGGTDARESGELVVRLGRCRESATSGFVLGEAVIDLALGTGVHATVYVDRVEAMAERAKSEMAPLLGRAIAHEVGHLLLRTNSHSASGLMRANWTPENVRRNQAGDWLLTKDDIDAIRERRR